MHVEWVVRIKPRNLVGLSTGGKDDSAVAVAETRHVGADQAVAGTRHRQSLAVVPVDAVKAEPRTFRKDSVNAS